MVEYICNRCGYNAKQKINLVRHLNRKNICSPLLEDISIEEVKNYYGLKIIPKQPKQHPNSTQTALFENEKQHPNSTQTAPKQHKQHPNSTQIFFRITNL